MLYISIVIKTKTIMNATQKHLVDSSVYFQIDFLIDGAKEDHGAAMSRITLGNNYSTWSVIPLLEEANEIFKLASKVKKVLLKMKNDEQVESYLTTLLENYMRIGPDKSDTGILEYKAKKEASLKLMKAVAQFLPSDHFLRMLVMSNY